MRLVTWNIQFSLGQDFRYDLPRIADTVAGADIIALQEVERFWSRSGMKDQPAALHERLRDHYFVFAPVFDVHGGGPPASNRRRQFGNLTLSRYPILASRTVVLPKTHYPDAFNMYQGALETVIDSPLGVLSLWNVHLGYLESAERLQQLDELRKVIERSPREAGAWSGPADLQGTDWSDGSAPLPAVEHTLICGDFNSEPGSPEHDAVLAMGYRDTALLGNADPAHFTHVRPYSAPPLKRRLDYCHVSAHLAPRLVRYTVDEVARGSDHHPVWTVFA